MIKREVFCIALLVNLWNLLPSLYYNFLSMSYAIIKTGGKQYRVTEGDILDVEKLDVETGQSTTFTEIIMVADGTSVTFGSPFVSNASVQAEVVDQWKGEKVIAFKFRRRKGYHRTVGHRRKLTKLKITSITNK